MINYSKSSRLCIDMAIAPRNSPLFYFCNVQSLRTRISDARRCRMKLNDAGFKSQRLAQPLAPHASLEGGRRRRTVFCSFAALRP